MANTSSFYGSRPVDPEDGWGPATSFHSPGRASAPAEGGQRSRTHAGSSRPGGGRGESRSGARATDPREDDYWNQSDPIAPETYAALYGDPYAEPEQAAGTARERLAAVLPARADKGRGLPAWGGLLVLIGIAAIGGAIDMASGTSVRGGFNIGIIVASVVAILLVRRSAMFPIVIAPPIVYSAASGLTLYIRSGGLDDHKVLIDAAANWLVYGFPAIAAATAAVLIIAGVRMIIRK